MIKRVFRQMLLTQIVSGMTVTICMLIDSIMIGRFLGVNAMSAYGLATPLLLIFAALGSLISAGVQVCCGRTMGSGDRAGTDACFTLSVLLAAGISLLGLLLVFLFLGPLTTLLGAGAPGPGNEVFSLTKDYLTGFILGAPAFLSAQIMVPYMQLSGSRTRLVAAVIAMTVSDVVGDLLVVFVFHGGTLGMGLASSISYYVAFLVAVGYFFRKDCLFRFRPRLVSGRACRELLAGGVPTVVNSISLVGLVFLLNRLLMSAGGAAAVAAYSVISTVGNLCYCFGAGVGSVGLMLGAIFYTDRDRASLRELVRVQTRWAIVLDVGVTLLGLLAAAPLVDLFLGSHTEARDLAILGLRLFVLSMVPSSLNSTFKNYFQGVGRVRLTELISVLQNLLLPGLFALLLSPLAGTTGVWLCFLCGESAALLVWSALVWRHYGRISLSAAAYEMLDPDFGVRPENCLELQVRSAQEAARASELAEDFCKAHGLSPRDAMFIGLCIEEMTANIVQHGFRLDKLRHNIDVRLVLEGESRVLRIRDDCIGFDPVHYLELHESEDDPLAHVGIRMVMKTVREASYVNTLGLNNLSLVF